MTAAESHHHTKRHGQQKNVFMERSFWLHVLGHMKDDILSALSFLRHLGGIICAVLLGVTLFLLEFRLISKVAFFATCGLLFFLLIAYPILTPIIFAVVISAFFPEKGMGKFFWPMTLSVIVFISYTLFLLV